MNNVMKRGRMSRLSLALSAALGLTAATMAFAAPLDDLRKLVESGQFEVAYKAAQANPEQIGTPHYDFLYGMAAIGAGHVPEGLLALERHLSAVPANDRARLELARGYFLLGEYGRARTEFDFVLKHNPPKEVQANIHHYLDSMQTRDSTDLRSTSRFYVDAGYGHDSNINGGTFNKDIRLLSGIIPLANASSMEKSDNFRQLTTGGQFMKRISPQLSVFAGGDMDIHSNEKSTIYNTNNYGLFTGLSYLQGSGLYRISIADSELAVGSGARYRSLFSITGEAQYTLEPGRTLTGFTQYGETSFLSANQVLDSKMATVGGTLSQAFEGVEFNPTAGLRMSVAKENNLRMRPDLSRRIATAQLFGSLTPMDHLGVNLGLTWQQQNFQKADLAFGSARQDTMKSLDIGVNYALDRNWTLRAEFQRATNGSNQNLYDYVRRSSVYKARYEF